MKNIHSDWTIPDHSPDSCEALLFSSIYPVYIIIGVLPYGFVIIHYVSDSLIKVLASTLRSMTIYFVCLELSIVPATE